jgi:shikimate kinase
MMNIYLVGFMATGKTATGEILAARLKRPFVDMDGILEARENGSISDIFASKGELYFRRLEKGLVVELAAKNNLVVACGGGVFASRENIDRMKASGLVICLASSPEKILERAKKFTNRPLLNVDKPLERIRELMAKRAPFYAEAHHTVDVERSTPAQAADAVIELLERHGQA